MAPKMISNIEARGGYTRDLLESQGLPKRTSLLWSYQNRVELGTPRSRSPENR